MAGEEGHPTPTPTPPQIAVIQARQGTSRYRRPGEQQTSGGRAADSGRAAAAPLLAGSHLLFDRIKVRRKAGERLALSLLATPPSLQLPTPRCWPTVVYVLRDQVSSVPPARETVLSGLVELIQMLNKHKNSYMLAKGFTIKQYLLITFLF